jgi:hypothetical protein
LRYEVGRLLLLLLLKGSTPFSASVGPKLPHVWIDHEEIRWEVSGDVLEFGELDEAILDGVARAQWAKAASFLGGRGARRGRRPPRRGRAGSRPEAQGQS